MKKTRFIFFLMMLPWVASAQDLQRFSERDIAGTARYIGMAGAMTAVGGDPSAILDNPAGLGIYRHVEMSITFNETLDYTHQNVASYVRQGRHHFTVPQASLVIAMGANNDDVKMKFCNLMVGFHRVKSFNRTSQAYMTNPNRSIADMAAEQVEGLYRADMDAKGSWDDDRIGWLGLLNYYVGAIEPVASRSETGKWKSVENARAVDDKLVVEETGYMDEFNINWAGNFSNRLYLGLGLDVRSLQYGKRYTNLEKFMDGGSSQLYSTLSQTGIGVNGSIGLMYQPIEHLRLGAAFHTPAIMSVTTKTEGSMDYCTDSMYVVRSNFYSATNKLSMPLRVNVGATCLLGSKGMISLEYAYRYWKEMEDVHTFKVGGEVVLTNNFFMELGYAYESSFSPKELLQPLTRGSIRMDADFRNIKDTHYAGCGLGYRGNFFIAQLGYQFRWQNYNLYAHALQGNPFDMIAMSHRIVFTFAWHK